MKNSPRPVLAVNVLLLDLARSNEKGGPTFQRVLNIASNGRRLVLFEIPATAGVPHWHDYRVVQAQIETGQYVLQSHDPFVAPVAHEESLSEKARSVRDARWLAIQPLVADAEGLVYLDRQRGRLVAAAAERSGCSRSKVYRWLRLYWQGGQTPNALLPGYDRCGGAGKERNAGDAKRGAPSELGRADSDLNGINIVGDVRDRLIRGIKKYVIGKRVRPKKAYDKTLAEFFSTHRVYDPSTGTLVPMLPSAEELPTFDQFVYWSRKVTRSPEAERKRRGERQYNLRHRPVLGSNTDPGLAPGSLYQVDATIGDLHLLSSIVLGRIIGRPVIYLVADVFSQMLVGYYAGLEGPSWTGMMMALQSAFSDKREFCHRLGHDIESDDWPCAHLPQQLLGDRGELISKHADQLTKGLGINVSNAAPWRADWKAIVERSFRTLNDEMLHSQPGAVQKARERGDPDSRLDAVLTMPEFNRMMLLYILRHNHERALPESRIPAGFPDAYSGRVTPIDLWRWGVQHRSGRLRAAPPEQVRMHLLPRKRARVTGEGILDRGLHYVPTHLQSRFGTATEVGSAGVEMPSATIEEWFLRNVGRKTKFIDIAYDPRDAGWIYLPSADGQSVMPCVLKGTARDKYTGMSFDEVKDARKFHKLREQESRSAVLQKRVAFQTEVEAIVDRARQRRDALLQSEGVRLDVHNVREQRQQDRSANRIDEAFRLGGTLPPEPFAEMSSPDVPSTFEPLQDIDAAPDAPCSPELADEQSPREPTAPTLLERLASARRQRRGSTQSEGDL